MAVTTVPSSFIIQPKHIVKKQGPDGMIEFIRRLGSDALVRLQSLGAAGIFLWHTLVAIPSPRTSFPLLIKQLYAVGVLSLAIIVVSGLFIGLVLGLQGYNILITYGSEQALGSMVSLTLVRELGPVVTALLFAGRAGSALTAEIGLMTVSYTHLTLPTKRIV